MKILYRRYHCSRALVSIPDSLPWRLYTDLNSKLDAELRLAFGREDLVLADSELLCFDHKGLCGTEVCECYDQVIQAAADKLARENPQVLDLETLMDAALAEWEDFWDKQVNDREQ